MSDERKIWVHRFFPFVFFAAIKYIYAVKHLFIHPVFFCSCAVLYNLLIFSLDRLILLSLTYIYIYIYIGNGIKKSLLHLTYSQKTLTITHTLSYKNDNIYNSKNANGVPRRRKKKKGTYDDSQRIMTESHLSKTQEDVEKNPFLWSIQLHTHNE